MLLIVLGLIAAVGLYTAVSDRSKEAAEIEFCKIECKNYKSV